MKAVDRLNVRPHALLFDLDGTLLDTAPQIGAALNQLLHSEGRPALRFDLIRANVSAGTNALVHIAFPETVGDNSAFARLRDQLLDIYQCQYMLDSKLFDGLEQVIASLGEHAVKWGIVTNKIARLTLPIVQHLNFFPVPASVVSGDTAPRPKPFPDPLLLAAQDLNLDPRDCVYIGDARTDIAAGKAAGMFTIAAGYGYIHDDDGPDSWNADIVVSSTQELRAWISSHCLDDS